MGFRDYRTLRGTAVNKAKMLGLGRLEVLQMAREAAVYSHRQFNRRFERYVLLVDGDAVLDIGVLAPDGPRECLVQAAELLRGLLDAPDNQTTRARAEEFLTRLKTGG